MGAVLSLDGVEIELRPGEKLVRLKNSDLLTAGEIGWRRRVQHLAKRKPPHHRYGLKDEDGIRGDVEGALGEWGVAFDVGLAWSGNMGDTKAADAGPLQVRAIFHRDDSLIVREHDSDEAAHVLVLVVQSVVIVVGWMFGDEAKRVGRKRDPGGKGHPAYFVPQEALRPWDELSGVATRLFAAYLADLRQGIRHRDH